MNPPDRRRVRRRIEVEFGCRGGGSGYAHLRCPQCWQIDNRRVNESEIGAINLPIAGLRYCEIGICIVACAERAASERRSRHTFATHGPIQLVRTTAKMTIAQ